MLQAHRKKIKEAARKRAEKRPDATNKPAKRSLTKKKNQNVEPDIHTDEDDCNLDYDELHRPPEHTKRTTIQVALNNKLAKRHRSKQKNQENIQPCIHHEGDDVAVAEVNRPTQPTTSSGRKVIAKVRTSM